MPSAAEQLASNFNLSAFSKATELKQRILFTAMALVVARLGTYIPMPGIDATELARQIFQQQQGILDVFNLRRVARSDAWRSSRLKSCPTYRRRSSSS